DGRDLDRFRVWRCHGPVICQPRTRGEGECRLEEIAACPVHVIGIPITFTPLAHRFCARFPRRAYGTPRETPSASAGTPFPAPRTFPPSVPRSGCFPARRRHPFRRNRR